MKNMIILGLLLGCISPIACKKEALQPKDLILGKWRYEKFGQESPIGSPEQIIENPPDYYFDFFRNGTANVNVNNNVQSTWALKDGGKTLLMNIFISKESKILKLEKKEFVFYQDIEENGQTKRNTYYLMKP